MSPMTIAGTGATDGTKTAILVVTTAVKDGP